MDTTWYLQYTSGLEHRSLRTRLATAPQARSSHPQEITCLQPAVVPSLSVNWVYVLPVVIDAISQAPHMPVPALWRGQPIYIPLQCREHVLADKQSQQSFWWGGDEKMTEFERSLTIIPTLDILAERLFSLLRSEMELNIHPTEFLSPFLCKAAAISHLSVVGLWY